jgi:hypothetical protein
MWVLIVLTRLRFGQALWRVPLLAALYVSTTTVAFGLTLLTGLMGARLVEGRSMIGPALGSLGIDHTIALVIGPTTALIIAALSIVVILACLVVSFRRKIKLANLIKESSERSQWPGPGR